MNSFTVEFYEKRDGKCPVLEFLNTLDLKKEAKMAREITLLEMFGANLREPHCKYIDDGIFELRVVMGSNIFRIFYFFHLNKRIIMTNGFIKKTNRIPKRELKLAKNYRKDFLQREGI